MSDIACKFLKDNEEQPVYDIRAINYSLYKKISNLRKFRELRIKGNTSSFINVVFFSFAYVAIYKALSCCR